MIELLAITEDPERIIEQAGRNCYQSECNNREIIKAWIKNGHESVLEHACATFEITCSRACMAQLTRHRIASFSIKSQRYVKEDDFDFYTPMAISNLKTLAIYNRAMKQCQIAYDELLALGVKAEDARFVLPNACLTKIVFTMNFRELRHFFKLRIDSHAQAEIRNIAKIMLDIVHTIAPNTFDDIKKEFTK